MRSFITIFVLLLATASHAASVNIDFDGAAKVSGAIQVPQGYTFTTNAPLFSTVQLGGFCPVSPGPPSVGNFLCAIDYAQAIVNFERIDGSAFNLLAMDVTMVSRDCGYPGNLCTSDNATISAWNSSNQLIATKTIAYSALGGTWSTVTFDGSWTGISRLTYAGQFTTGDWETFSYAYLDNIQVSVVPIPPAIWLFGSALAGLGWLRRKQAV